MKLLCQFASQNGKEFLVFSTIFLNVCIFFSENAADSFLSTYVCPEPKSSVNQALLCTVTGFIPPENVFLLLQELR